MKNQINESGDKGNLPEYDKKETKSQAKSKKVSRNDNFDTSDDEEITESDRKENLPEYDKKETKSQAKSKKVSKNDNFDTSDDEEITDDDRKENVHKSQSKKVSKNAGRDESEYEDESYRDHKKEETHKTKSRKMSKNTDNAQTDDTEIVTGPKRKQAVKMVQSKKGPKNVNPDQSNDEDTELSRLNRKEKMLDKSLRDDRKCSKSLPDAIIVGVMKGGTETLATFLTVHPSIAMQQKVRAVQFFNKYYDNGLEWYRNQMPCSKPDQITMEKSPQYFIAAKTPGRIYEMNSLIKLIMIVREPISRMISHYDHLKAINPEQVEDTLDDEILKPNGEIDKSSIVIAISLYAIHIKRWLEEFNLKQIHIVDGDNFTEDPSGELNKIETFLGLSHFITEENFEFDEEKGFYCLKTTKDVNCMPKGKGRKHKELDPELLEKLQKLFKPYNEKFFKIIKKRFDWDY